MEHISPFTLVETEEMFYGLFSFVAEVGGTLGLFLGFSLMAIWDGIDQMSWVFVEILKETS